MCTADAPGATSSASQKSSNFARELPLSRCQPGNQRSTCAAATGPGTAKCSSIVVASLARSTTISFISSRAIHSVRISEGHLQRQLYAAPALARLNYVLCRVRSYRLAAGFSEPRAGNLIRSARRCRRSLKAWMVERVERFQTKLHPHPLGQLEHLLQAHIAIPVAGAAEQVATHSIVPCRRECKRGRVAEINRSHFVRHFLKLRLHGRATEHRPRHV